MTVDDFAALINDENGAQWFLDACRAAAAQPPPPVNAAPPVVVHVMLQVAVPPQPPPPPINLVLQVAVPAVATATVGTTTDRCSTRTAQAQTARSLFGTTTAAQTDTTALSMEPASTTTEGTASMVVKSTDTYLDKVGGLMRAAVQTEESVVSASDYEQLGAPLAASVDEAQQAKMALAKKAAGMDGLLVAIVRRKRIDMDGMRYNVWCEGEAASLSEPPDGVCASLSFPDVSN